MKKIAEILVVFCAVLSLASCSNPFNDIRVTSCDLVSASPRGLSAFDAVLDVSVDNPAPQITLSGANAVVKLEGVPCLYLTADDVTVKVGGAMMGIPIDDLDVPVLKGANGVIAYDNDRTEAQPCIKCGRCVDVCPMELEPLYFQKFADENNWIGMKQYNVMDCIECRCCEYICSSKIPLVTKIKAGKTAIREMK